MEQMLQNIPLLILTALFAALILLCLLGRKIQMLENFCRLNKDYLYLLLVMIFTELFDPSVSLWGWGILSFFFLRKYISMVELRFQDRYAVWAAYLMIPLIIVPSMTYDNWWQIMLIAIPMSYFIIPLFVVFGGKDSRGSLMSIATLLYGITLYVLGLAMMLFLFYSDFFKDMIVLLILSIMAIDFALWMIRRFAEKRWLNNLLGYVIAFLVTASLAFLLTNFTGFSWDENMIFSILVPITAVSGMKVMDIIEGDLGIGGIDARFGSGRIQAGVKAIFFTSIILFYCIWYIVENDIL